MLVHIDNRGGNSDNIVLVTCTAFFDGNRLILKSNNSATVNIWTSLGQPSFTTGIWNSENYTTSLTLDTSSIAELNWNTYNVTTYVDNHSNVSPSNISVSYGDNQTFIFSATEGYIYSVDVDGLSQGQVSDFTFSNMLESHKVNVTSTLISCTINAFADAGSTISPSGLMNVNYGTNQSFAFKGRTGYTLTHIYVDGVDKGAIDEYSFSYIKENHTISVNSKMNSPTNSSLPKASPAVIPKTTIEPSQYPLQTNMPSSTSILQPRTDEFSDQMDSIVVIAVLFLAAILALSFKKGYLSISITEEESKESLKKELAEEANRN